MKPLPKIESEYEIFHIICKVERQEDKLYLYDNFKKLIDKVETLTNGWKYKKMKFDILKTFLVKNRNGEFIRDKENPSIVRVTHKVYPVGGYRNLTDQNLIKLSVTPFENAHHLKYGFDNYGKVDYFSLFPKDNSGLIEFSEGRVVASKDVKRSGNEIMDLYFSFNDRLRSSVDSPNQACQLIVKRGVISSEKLAVFLKCLFEICFAVEVYKNNRPFRKIWIDEYGMQCFNEIIGDDFYMRRRDETNQFGNPWEKIYPSSDGV